MSNNNPGVWEVTHEGELVRRSYKTNQNPNQSAVVSFCVRIDAPFGIRYFPRFKCWRVLDCRKVRHMNKPGTPGGFYAGAVWLNGDFPTLDAAFATLAVRIKFPLSADPRRWGAAG